MSDQEKPEDVQGQSDTQETPQDAEPATEVRGGSLGGSLFFGAVLLVIAAVCYWDGFHSPPEKWAEDHWKVVVNQIIAVVGGLAGLAIIVRGLLQPRGETPVQEEQEEPGDGTP